MPRPAVGRRTDSLFDNRYRYDYIYPRGRSGETLRAYDTQDGDRPVVIKRPAPQDAPPMRAGQEVSILNEKRALERLAGHAVLCELLNVGTFRASGQEYTYIVVELAEGKTVEDYVLELSAQGARLPELEIYTILDGFLDLLQAAHERKIVYNDADAKHLFWDRQHYKLKVIDWGNAVFLDGDAPIVDKSADAFQVGELLHFVLTGGKRLEIDRRSGERETYANLSDEIPPRVKSIISKATAAEPHSRYQDIAQLRRDLADVRRPIEKTRDQILDRVRKTLPNATSQDQFGELAAMLRDAEKQDPGNPTVHALLSEVDARLRQLSIQGDLDAARIYLESGNMRRAIDLLEEIGAHVGNLEDQPLLRYLLEAARQLEQLPLSRPPAGLAPALDALYRGDMPGAGRALVITPETRIDAKEQQLLLAEKLTQLVPGVVLLRPHLARVDQLLNSANRAGDRAILMRLTSTLDAAVERGVQPLRRVYLNLFDTLSGFAERLDGDARQSCERAERAAGDIADLLEIVGANVLSDPSRARNALRQAAAIDPANPAFDALQQYLSGFQAELDTIADARPGGEIGRWLTETRERMTLFVQDVPDPQIRDMIARLDAAANELTAANAAFASGGKRPAVEAYRRALEAISPINEAVARWFSEHARQIEDARFAEALHPDANFGKALSDGWDAWDKGRNGDAQSQGGRALELARTPGDRAAAEKLIRVAELTNTWLSNNGIGDKELTEQTENTLIDLLTPDEIAIQRKFSEQMPTRAVYLKAMSRGLVEPMRDASSAAVRILKMHFTLRGVAALIEEQPEEAEFWKEAASRTLPNARMHPAFIALDNGMTRRVLLAQVATALNAVNSLESLPAARAAIRQPLVQAQVDPAEAAIRNIDDAIKKWQDGDFRSAHSLLDSAYEKAQQAEYQIGKPLDAFKNWLSGLNTTAESLQQARRVIEQAALIPQDLPDPAVNDAHTNLFNKTRALLGEDYAAVLRNWRDTYTNILDLYTDERFTKPEKLRLLENQLGALLIEKHPAFPIYRHWNTVIRSLPDPEPKYSYTPTQSASSYEGDGTVGFVEETVKPNRVIVSHQQETTPPTIIEPARIERQSVMDNDAPIEPEPFIRTGSRRSPAPAPRLPWVALLLAASVILIAIVAAVVVISGRDGAGAGGIQLTLPATPTVAENVGISTEIPTDAATNTPAFTDTPAASETPRPTDTPAPTSTPAVSDTPALVPTETRPFATLPPFESPVPLPPTVAPTNPPAGATSAVTIPTRGAATPLPPGLNVTGVASATLPADAAAGEYDLLADMSIVSTDVYTWPLDLFSPDTAEGGWKLGTSNTRGGNVNQFVRIGPNTLATLYGVNASRQVTGVEATFELVSYNRSLAPIGQVYFGLGFEAPAGQQSAYAQVAVAQSQTLAAALSTKINGRLNFRSSKPGSPIKVTLSAQRNKDRTVSLFADGQLLGTTTAVYGPATSVNIVLYTSAPTVLVNVSALKVKIG
jgi:hypothetical protein